MALSSRTCATRSRVPLCPDPWPVSALSKDIFAYPTSCSASGLPRAILWAHAIVTIIFPYLHSRLRIYALSRAWPDMPSSDSRRKAWAVLTRIESVQNFLDLASLIAFLCDGRLAYVPVRRVAVDQRRRYRTWADRLLHLRLVPLRGFSTREVSYEFMNRQMVWHAFTVS